MKGGLTNIDVYVLSREIQPRRFSKIVRTDFGYKVKFQGAKDLIVIPGKFIIPTDYVIEAGRPDNLSIISRKRMGNAFVTSVEQINFDRILRISTERGSIIIESFGDGNIILTDENGVIVYALHERDWRDRSVRRGVMYNPPPPPKLHPNIDFDSFSALFTGKDVVRSLVRAGLPPVYAEELCIIAGVDKNTPVSDVSPTQIESLYRAFVDMIRRLDDPDPVVVLNGEEIVDVTPIPLNRYEDLEFRHFNTLSSALDYLTPHLISIPPKSAQKKEKRSMVEFWREQLEAAKKELAELEQMIEKAYEYSYELSTAIEAARSGGTPSESIGPFRFKRKEGKELVFDFTPRP